MRKLINWIANRHWWLIAFVALILLVMEGVDIIRHTDNQIHLTELVIYLALLAVIGVLYDSASRAVKNRSRMSRIIEYKHRISQEFSIYNDWDVLVTQLARFPGTITNIETSSLYVCDPISNQFDLATLWPPDRKMVDPLLAEAIKQHIKDKDGVLTSFSQCFVPPHLKTATGDCPQIYCLPIRFGQSLLGLIGFNLKAGVKLSNEERDIFINVGDEIGFAFKVGQDRKSYFEMSASETTLAERRRVSHYLHDHLGHNLGYLHLKLDQLLSARDELSLDSVLEDLVHLREAAAESYEIVRGTLETMQPQTVPTLTNLLMEHASRVSGRANIQIDFQTSGIQVPLAVDIKRVLFYVFEEALSNAEKHAHASRITAFTDWAGDSISLTISDNGVGFNPADVNTAQHFGLEILRERLDQVGGQVSIESSEETGTVISVWVPLPVNQPVGVNL